MLRFAHITVLTSLLVVASGCDKSLEESFGVSTPEPKKPKQQPAAPPPRKPSVEVSRKITLEIAGEKKPVSTAAGFAWFAPQVLGGPSVVRVTSYPQPDKEQFPSVLIWAKVEGGRIDAVVGQQVQARIFIQRNPSGPVLQTADGEPATVQFTTLQDGWLGGKIVSGTLIHSETQQPHNVSGQFGGKVMKPGAGE